MNSLGDLIREERERKGLSQQQLADQLPGITRETISKYEHRERIPYDSLLRIIEALKSPRLRLKLLGGAVPCYDLDNVDSDRLATVGKAIELMERYLPLLKRIQIMLINKKEPGDLSAEERDKLINEGMLPMQDINVCMDLTLASLSETFGVDLEDEVVRSHKEKMRRKGYTSSKLEMVW